jgi:hypothetical protein
MLGKQFGWNFFVNLILTLSTLNGKRTKVLMHSTQRMHVMHVTTISKCKSNLKNIIFKALVLYEHYLQVIEELQQKYGYYKIKYGGILIHKNRVYVPFL